MLFCRCSAAAAPGRSKMDVLDADDVNHRIATTLDRAADKPLIIRRVAGTDGKKLNVPGPDGKKIDVRRDLAADKGNDVSADVKDDHETELKDENKKTADAEMRAVDDGWEAAAAAAGGGGGRFSEFMAMLDEELSQGRNSTPHGADRALRAAPFTQASYAASLICSELAGGGPAVSDVASTGLGPGVSEVVGPGRPGVDSDEDEEAGDGNVAAGTGLAATSSTSKSPVGSSSSAQQRCVQQMLRQIQDAGERINERIGARDFGARHRRRLPAVPLTVDSDLPTATTTTHSSQSAQSDAGSGGETQPPEYHRRRPVRSVLEEFHRAPPAIRSPKSSLKNTASLSRQLPTLDPSTVKHCAGTDGPSTSGPPVNLRLSEFAPPSDGIDVRCSGASSAMHCGLDDHLSAMHCGLDDRVPNTALTTRDVDVPAQVNQLHNNVAQVNQLDNDLPAVNQLDNGVGNPECSRLPGAAGERCESETSAGEIAKFPDPSTAAGNDCVASVTPRMHYDRDLLAYAVKLIAAESCWLGDAGCSDSSHDVVGRGRADGESARDSVNDEGDRQTGLSDSLQSPLTRLLGLYTVPACDLSPVIPCSHTVIPWSHTVPACDLSPVIPRSHTVIPCSLSSVACVDAESSAQKIAASSQSAFNRTCHRCLLSSDAIRCQTDCVNDTESKRGPNVNSECVYKDSLVDGQTSGVLSSEVAELLWTDSRNAETVHDASVNGEPCQTSLSMPDTWSWSQVNVAATASDARLTGARPSDAGLTGACPCRRGENNAKTTPHDVLFPLHDDEDAHNQVSKRNAGEMTNANSSPATAAISKPAAVKSGDVSLLTETDCNAKLCQETFETLTEAEETKDNSLAERTVKLKPVDDWLFAETDRDIKHCQETFKQSALIAATEQDVESSSACTDNHNPVCSGTKDDELFCLAGPRRALSNSRYTCAVIGPTLSQPLAGLTPVVSSTKSDRLKCVHTPVIRSTNVRSSVPKHSAVNSQRKPAGSVAVKFSGSTLSRLTGLPPPVRLTTHSPSCSLPPPVQQTTHSPQPPSVPASRPAAAAAQARFVTV